MSLLTSRLQFCAAGENMKGFHRFVVLAGIASLVAMVGIAGQVAKASNNHVPSRIKSVQILKSQAQDKAIATLRAKTQKDNKDAGGCRE